MSRKVSKSSRIIPLAVLLIFLTGIQIIGLDRIQDFYQTHVKKEKTFVSERAKFSFNYPSDWPVSPVSDEDLKQNNMDFDEEKKKWIAVDREIESIDFAEKWYRNAGGERLGRIIVEKTLFKNTQEYAEDLGKERAVDLFVKGRSQMTIIPAPKIENTTIDKQEALKVMYGDLTNQFDSSNSEYHLVRNGWLYRFSGDNNSSGFQKIISSVKFF